MIAGGFEVMRAVAVLLAAGALLALARHAWTLRSGPRSRRAFGMFAALVVLHGLVGFLLWRALFPPMTRIAAETLTVLTAGAPADPERSKGRMVALPEATRGAGAERGVDLASVLRRYPDTRRLRVLGEGLTARDRDAASKLVVEFNAAPEPAGLAETHAPQQVAQGARWTMRGRVAGGKGGAVRLRDPSGVVVARATLPPDGRFALAAIARTPGASAYVLQILRRDGTVLEETQVPIDVVPGDRVRLLLLAGAPGPELKYLRRWAVDAGLDVRSDIALGAVARLRSGAAPSSRRFADADLVVVDERAWRSLGDSGREELLAAVRAGAGLLFRITGRLSETDRNQLAALGFVPTRVAADVAAAPAPAKSGAGPAALRLRRERFTVADGFDLADARDGLVLGVARNEGRGRIGVWWAVETYRRVLAGSALEHGALWSGVTAELSRRAARPPAPRWTTSSLRVGERGVVCGVAAGSTVIAVDRRVVELQVVPEAGAATGHCAGFWPRSPGWHSLRIGDWQFPFHVRALTDAPGLAAHANREATLKLAVRPAPRVIAATTQHPQSRWPWLLAWLAASAALWWLERVHARARNPG